MKLFEILQNDASDVTEENLITRLKNFDWKYEFAEDAGRQRRGGQAMNILENAVYKLWKKNPDLAIEIWNSYSPQGSPGTVPSFILRLESQDR